MLVWKLWKFCKGIHTNSTIKMGVTLKMIPIFMVRVARCTLRGNWCGLRVETSNTNSQTSNFLSRNLCICEFLLLEYCIPFQGYRILLQIVDKAV